MMGRMWIGSPGRPAGTRFGYCLGCGLGTEWLAHTSVPVGPERPRLALEVDR